MSDPTILATGSMTVPGIFVCTVLVGLLFGVPLAAVRALLPGKKTRAVRFGQALLMSFAAAFLVMLTIYFVGP